MNKTIGLQLLVFSALLAALSYLAYSLAPAAAQTTLFTGLIGGALCLLGALRVLDGKTGKSIPLLILIPIAFVFLAQMILAWGEASQGSGVAKAASVITILFICSLGMLMRIAYAGMFGKSQTGDHSRLRTSPERGHDNPSRARNSHR